jgi:2-polyprenyl-6-methoxyphenol hydroxylase-like FAD-dependent oxidoreductase
MGINLAVQDAVATARILAEPLQRHRVTRSDLAKVQRRREMPTVIIQTTQRLLQRVLFAPAFAGRRSGASKAAVFRAHHRPLPRRWPSISASSWRGRQGNRR